MCVIERVCVTEEVCVRERVCEREIECVCVREGVCERERESVCGPTRQSRVETVSIRITVLLQGYLAHRKQPPPRTLQ